MADRYFVEEAIRSERVKLVGPEAHHLMHVMRAERGAQVVVFDGAGAEFTALVERLGRNEVELSIVSREEIDRELPVAITLGAALPKGDRQKWLVEKAVELGVAALVPLRTTRGVAQPVEQAIARLRRSAIEAAKQCGRNRLMQIDEPREWADFVADATDAPCRLIAHPQREKAAAAGQNPFSDAKKPGNSVFLAIGPEGGFTDDEVRQAVDAGWTAVDLGPRILRVETAALLMAARVIAAL